MLQENYNDPQTYRRTLMIYGGEARDAFVHLVKKIVARVLAQTEVAPAPEAVLVQFAHNLWALARKHGRPAPLAPGEQGEAATLEPARRQALTDELFANFRFPAFAPPLRAAVEPFLEALFLPEFKQCRQSYKDPDASGVCERQQLGVARRRASGAHCADCPYWVALTPEKNEKLLLKEWPAPLQPELQAHLGVFLPEDFRALRRFLHMHSRFGRN